MKHTNDPFFIKLSIAKEQIRDQLTQRLPIEMNFGEHKVSLIAPWKLRSQSVEIANVQGHIALDYLWKTNLHVLGAISFDGDLNLAGFPDLNLSLRQLELADTPKLRIFNFISIPIRWLLASRLKKSLPEIEGQLNKEAKAQLKKQLELLPERLKDRLPAGFHIALNGLESKFQSTAETEHIFISPSVAINSEAGQGSLSIAKNLAGQPEAMDLQLEFTLAQINEQLEQQIKDYSIDTPAGNFVISNILAKISAGRLSFAVNFAKESNGHLLLHGQPQIQTDGKELTFAVDDIEWMDVSLIKKGMLAIFSGLIKNKLNEALSFDEAKINKMLLAQRAKINKDYLKEFNSRLDSIELQTFFRETQVLNGGIKISATLSGQLSIAID